MKFGGSQIITKPREEVVKYFIAPLYLGEYQDGFIKKEVIRGEAGHDGAVSMMYYKYGSRDMELEETIDFVQLNQTHLHFWIRYASRAAFRLSGQQSSKKYYCSGSIHLTTL